MAAACLDKEVDNTELPDFFEGGRGDIPLLKYFVPLECQF